MAVSAAGAAAAAAVLGGAFRPGQMLGVSAAMAGLALAAVGSGAARLGRAEAVLLACLGWGAVAAALARTSPLAAKESLAAWGVAVLLFAVARRRPERAVGPVLVVLGFAGLMLVAGQLAQALVLGTARPGGVFVNANLVAALLVPLVPLFLVRLPRAPGLVLAAAALAGVGLSGSRAAILALAAVLLVAGLGRRPKVLAAVVLAAGAALVWWRFRTHPDPLAWYRVRIWGALLELLGRHPLAGIGPGGFPDATGVVRLATPTGCALHARRIGGAESTLLSWAVQGGLVGVALGFGAAGVLWRELRARVAGRRAGLAGALAAMGVMALFHDFLGTPVVLWWWAVVAGVAAGAPEAQPRSAGTPRWPRWSAAMVAAGLIGWGLAQPATARLLAAGRCDQATAERVLRLEPWLDDAALCRVDTLLAGGGWDWTIAGQALRWSEVAAAAHPGGMDDWLAVARVNARIVTALGTWPAAVERARGAFARATTLEPRLPWAWVEWARLERALGRPDRARELCRRAIAAEPRCVRAWLLLGRIDLDLGRVDAARRDLDAARAARKCGEGRPLEAYERDLMAAPAWQWRALERAAR